MFRRFSRWRKHGIWVDLLAYVADDPDLQHLLIDSTVIRAHPCAAGAERRSAELEALGRSRGGFSTKTHAVTDAPGSPLAFVKIVEERGMDAVIHLVLTARRPELTIGI